MHISISTIFLIGGPPGGGKTTLGRRLGQRLDLPSLTVDDLRTAILGVTSAETHPDLHLVGMPDHIEYFTRTDPEQMVDDAMTQHTAMWPAILRVIRKRSRSGDGCVLDGWHFLPTEVSRIADGNVLPVWLDVETRVLEKRERAIWDFYAQSPDPQRMLNNFLGRSVMWNRLVCDRARDLDLHVVHQDGTKTPDDLCKELLDLSPIG